MSFTRPGLELAELCFAALGPSLADLERSATLRVRVQLGRDEELSSPKTVRSGPYFDAKTTRSGR